MTVSVLIIADFTFANINLIYGSFTKYFKALKRIGKRAFDNIAVYHNSNWMVC